MVAGFCASSSAALSRRFVKSRGLDETNGVGRVEKSELRVSLPVIASWRAGERGTATVDAVHVVSEKSDERESVARMAGGGCTTR